MGDIDVRPATDPVAVQQFAAALLDDLRALGTMLAEDRLERGVTRLGFEQEMFLVDANGRPASVAMAVLETLDDTAFTHEIGLFNLEHNVPPARLGPGTLAGLERHLGDALARVRTAAARHGADVFLGGILPSLDAGDLTVANLTPLPRYHALNDMIVELAGGTLRTLIQGHDHLQLELDSVMLEACTTSIQVHLQVDPDRLVAAYNAAQAIAGPMVAVAANSPLLLQHRLWDESRIPAFQQGVDIRDAHHRRRDGWRRVHFGDAWVQESILEIYHDQVARHRLLLIGDPGATSTAVLAGGDLPRLRALSLHNGSLYRWNRPCYGLADGVAHLRIEHRPLPAGPTILDEVANTALFVGLVEAIPEAIPDLTARLPFDDARANFTAAARYGIDAAMRWLDGTSLPARELLTDTLLPLAERGLRHAGVTMEEIDRYLGTIRGRLASGRTGARWTLEAYRALEPSHRNRNARTQAVTRLIVDRQHRGLPVHDWPDPDGTERLGPAAPCRRVADIMSTDLFTVGPDDLLDVATSVMAWKHIRHVPVEDADGQLVGLVSHRDLLAMLARTPADRPRTVRELMRPEPRTVTPATSCADALRLLQDPEVGCLPVVERGRLIGIVTDRDFLGLAEAWIARSDS